MNTDAFLTAWLELSADPLAVAKRLNLTVEQLARHIDKPEVRKLLDIVDDLRARHARAIALTTQIAASDHLKQSLTQTTTPVERRRAATTLARVAHQMLSAIKPPPKPTQAPSPALSIRSTPTTPPITRPTTREPTRQTSRPTPSSLLAAAGA